MTKNQRFQRRSGVHGAFSKGGVYTCDFCGKRTRETGEGESDLGICRFCYLEAGLINELSDGMITQAEYDEQVAALKEGK